MKLFKRILVVLLILVIIAGFYNYPKLTIISGFASKNMASSVFIAGMSSEYIVENDNNIPLIKLAKVALNKNEASSTVFGLMERRTIYRDGLGCVLVNDQYDASLPTLKPKRSETKNNLPFPYGNNGQKDTVFSAVDYQLLENALDSAFAKPELQKTRTVLIAYKNHIIGERYIDEFSKDTPVLGWSMTKSILATLFGILEYQGSIDISKSAPIALWQDDERKNISLNHLLRMQSGLEWDEDYASISDVTQMLFLDADMTNAQMKKKAIAAPTAVWNYSSGTTNLLSGILRNRFDTHQDYLDFPYTALIDKIGMHSMLLEADMNGNYVGSSYGWANTRDWAKFGLLYLNKGRWNGEQLFDPAWVDYVAKPTALSKGTYGAHFWLNANGKYPDVPKDLYSANGFQGQFVFIIPSKDLVIVRTGLAEFPDFDANQFLKNILAAIQ
ncbi:MAG: serine hydrolase [Flavobacteriaceae bacterium]